MNEEMLNGFKRFVEGIQFIVADEYGKFLIMFIVILLTMLLDMVTGISQANTNQTVLSSKLSNGLIKKGQIILIVLVLMFIGICLPTAIGVPLIFLTFIYEIYNELVSITENLYKQGIEINFLKPILKVLKDEIDEREGNKNE